MDTGTTWFAATEYTSGGWGWNISTIAAAGTYSYTTSALSLGVAWSSDGLTCWVSDYGAETIYQLTASTAWDETTLSYASKSFSTAAYTTYAYDIFVDPTDTEVYITSYDTTLRQFTMGTPGDISTCTYTGALTVPATSFGCCISDDGLELLVTNSTTISRYTLGTAWLLSSGVDASDTYAPRSSCPGVRWGPRGESIWYTSQQAGSGTSRFVTVPLSTPYDLSSAGSDTIKDVTITAHSYTIDIKADGTKLWLIDHDNDLIRGYTMTT